MNDLALASLVAVAALPTIEAVMAPASKLPSASRLTSVFAVLLSVSSGRSYFREFHGVTPSPIFRREVSSSIPSSPCARIGLTFAHCCAPSLPIFPAAEPETQVHLGSPESLLANNAARRKAVRNYHYIKQKNCKDAARRRKSEQPADRANRPLGRPRAAISNAAAENDAEEEARDARRGER